MVLWQALSISLDRKLPYRREEMRSLLRMRTMRQGGYISSLLRGGSEGVVAMPARKIAVPSCQLLFALISCTANASKISSEEAVPKLNIYVASLYHNLSSTE
jgi:hypothetical protein